MTDALLIANIYNDIVFFLPFNEDDNRLIFLLAYSSLDIFDEVRYDINRRFYPFIDSYTDYNISILHTPASFKFIFVTKNKNGDIHRDFLEGSHKIFLKEFLRQTNNMKLVEKKIKKYYEMIMSNK